MSKSSLSLLLAASLFAACSASAQSLTATTSANKPPAPVSVVNPTGLPPWAQDMLLQIYVTIDEQGVPHDISFKGWVPDKLQAQLLPVLAKWRFSPAMENGQPVAGRFLLPIRLVTAEAS